MRLLKSIVITVASLVFTQLYASELTVGDGQIDGARIALYELSWHQCMLNEGNWVNLPALTERLDVLEERTIRLRQVSTRSDGGTTTATTYSDLHSFALQKMEMVSRGADGAMLASAEYLFDEEGYSGSKARGGESKKVSGTLSSNMLNGMTMGLPLATLPWQKSPLTFLASMINFDASYEVIATWVQEDVLHTQDGGHMPIWLLDIEWQVNLPVLIE